MYPCSILFLVLITRKGLVDLIPPQSNEDYGVHFLVPSWSSCSQPGRRILSKCGGSVVYAIVPQRAPTWNSIELCVWERSKSTRAKCATNWVQRYIQGVSGGTYWSHPYKRFLLLLFAKTPYIGWNCILVRWTISAVWLLVLQDKISHITNAYVRVNKPRIIITRETVEGVYITATEGNPV